MIRSLPLFATGVSVVSRDVIADVQMHVQYTVNQSALTAATLKTIAPAKL